MSEAKESATPAYLPICRGDCGIRSVVPHVHERGKIRVVFKPEHQLATTTTKRTLTFYATNMSDRRRCGLCRAIVNRTESDMAAHAASHDMIIGYVEPGLLV